MAKSDANLTATAHLPRVGLGERAWRALDRRLPSITRRHRNEVLPIKLDRKRIYIVPSGFGLFFAVMMFAVLAGALNYNNNGALLFGLLPVSLGLISMLQTFRNLDQLSLVQVSADPIFAGESVHLEWHLHADDGRARSGISLKYGAEHRHHDIEAGQTAVVRIALPARTRGWLVPESVRASTVWPFGLFFAWSYLHSNVRVLVYPHPESPKVAFPRTPDHTRSGGADPGDDDLRNLRQYVPGDPTRMIAWKASARTGDLLVRELEMPRASEMVFDFQQISGLDTEARLSRLTRWVIEADHAGMSYALKMPDATIGPASGGGHRLRCLTALATHALART